MARIVVLTRRANPTYHPFGGCHCQVFFALMQAFQTPLLRHSSMKVTETGMTIDPTNSEVKDATKSLRAESHKHRHTQTHRRIWVNFQIVKATVTGGWKLVLAVPTSATCIGQIIQNLHRPEWRAIVCFCSSFDRAWPISTLVGIVERHATQCLASSSTNVSPLRRSTYLSRFKRHVLKNNFGSHSFEPRASGPLRQLCCQQQVLQHVL